MAELSGALPTQLANKEWGMLVPGCPLPLLLCPDPQTTDGAAQSGWVFPPQVIFSGNAFFRYPEDSSPTSQAILNPVKLTSKIKYDGDVLPGWGPEGEGWWLHWSLGEIGNVIHNAGKWGEVRWKEEKEERKRGLVGLEMTPPT